MSLRQLARGLWHAPTFSLRQQALTYSLCGIILIVGAVDAGLTVAAVAIGAAVLVLMGAALVGQHYAETNGAVEREREQQEAVWAKRDAWSPAQWLAFRVFVLLVFLAVTAKGVLTIWF